MQANNIVHLCAQRDHDRCKYCLFQKIQTIVFSETRACVATTEVRPPFKGLLNRFLLYHVILSNMFIQRQITEHHVVSALIPLMTISTCEHSK